MAETSIPSPDTAEIAAPEIATVGGNVWGRAWMDDLGDFGENPRRWEYRADDVAAAAAAALADPHARAVLDQRLDAGTARPLEIAPGGDARRDRIAAEDLAEQFEAIEIDRISRELLHAVWYGYAVAEAIWEIDGGRVRLADLRCRDPERFRFRRDGTPLLITLDTPRGIELPEAKFCVLRQPRRHGGEPHGPGAARWCLWPVWLKRTGIRYWSVALEKFGAPALTCTVRHNAEPSEIAKALDAMGAIIGGASTVLQEGQEIELLEATRRAGGDYAVFTAAMDAMIADAVLGQRATSEIGPWQATAEIHAEVLQRLVAADARRLQATLRHSIAAWLTHWNHPGAATPRLARDTAPAEDLERRARRDAEIAAMSGLRPTQAYIERTYGGEWEEARQDAAEPAAPAAQRALADPGDGDAIATAVDRLIEDEGWEPLMEPLIQPVLDAARTSDDIDAFSRRIDGGVLWDAMETAPLAERLHRASFSAAISAAGAPVEDTAGDGGGEP